MGLVLLGALASGGLPVALTWLSTRSGADSRGAVLLLMAVVEAPIAALLGAVATGLLLRWWPAAVRRPGIAVAAAAAGAAGLLAGVYLHLVFRARAAGAPGVPPVDLLWRVDDFARAVPLAPATMLLALAVGPALAARGRASWGAVVGAGIGVAAGLGAGMASLVPAALAGPLGNAGALLAVSAAVVGVALRAGRRPPP